MSRRRNLVAIVAGLLERSGMGLWIRGRSKSSGIYLFLFGETGANLARILPTRAELRELAGDEAEELRLVCISERTGTAERMRSANHLAVCVNQIEELSSSQAVKWLMGVLRAQAIVCRPKAVLFTPEFAASFPRPRKLIVELRRMMRRLGESRPAIPVPSFLAGEIPESLSKVKRLIGKLSEELDEPAPLCLYHYGSPIFFDYKEFLGEGGGERVETLGWKLNHAEGGAAPNKGDEQNLFVLLNDWMALRQFLKEVRRQGLVDRIGRIVVFDAMGGVGLNTDRCQVMTDQELFLDQAATDAGLLVTDGKTELLPLLSGKSRVALIRGAVKNAASLVKYSYFAGQERWPVYDTCRQLAETLARQGIEELWAPYEDRRTEIEREDAAEFHRGFYERIYSRVIEERSSVDRGIEG